jgi:hypothetical protein
MSSPEQHPRNDQNAHHGQRKAKEMHPPVYEGYRRNTLPHALRLTGKKHASPFENHFTSTLKHLINDHH